jgi:hypothetical protein
MYLIKILPLFKNILNNKIKIFWIGINQNIQDMVKLFKLKKGTKIKNA